MKIKILTVLSLSAFLLMVGCKGAANTNTTNTAATMNSNSMTNSMTNTTGSMPVADTATKNTVESALTKAGITGVTVDATTTSVTLRGSVAKGKMGQAVQVAQEAGKKAVKNELTEK